MDRRLKNAKDKFARRIGWMTRVHPFVLDDRSWILPLYSDGFDLSIMALTDDAGVNWTASQPLVGLGDIQPSLVRKKDGGLVALMRHNGLPPKTNPDERVRRPRPDLGPGAILRYSQSRFGSRGAGPTRRRLGTDL